MTGELVKFVTVMLVVILGFVMAFYSIFNVYVTFGLVRMKHIPNVCQVDFLKKINSFSHSCLLVLKHKLRNESCAGSG